MNPSRFVSVVYFANEPSKPWSFNVSRRKRGPKLRQKPFLRTDRHLAGNSRTPTQVEYAPLYEPPPGRKWAHRLGWGGSPPSDYKAETFARMIRHPSNSEVQWVCDTNLFIAPTDQVVWDALLAKKGRLVVTAPVCRELEVWIADENRRNSSVAGHFKMVRSGDERAFIRLINVPKSNLTEVVLIEYYLNLIGMRKNAANIASRVYEEEYGRPPTNQELSNYKKDRMGCRARMIASSGASAKDPANKCNDEAMIVLALIDAIRSARETAIITRDEDVYEQFYKALWFLDTHYRAFLLAEKYHADPLAFLPVRRVTDPKRIAFEGEVCVFDRPSDGMREVLPNEYDGVSVHCFLIRDKLHHRSFMAERGMARMLDVKGRTGGLSTDRFNGLNCHVYLGPFMNEVGNCAAIGKDIPIKLGNGRVTLSLLDLNLCSRSRARTLCSVGS